jgi:hypothetical protein
MDTDQFKNSNEPPSPLSPHLCPSDFLSVATIPRLFFDSVAPAGSAGFIRLFYPRRKYGVFAGK